MTPEEEAAIAYWNGLSNKELRAGASNPELRAAIEELRKTWAPLLADFRRIEQIDHRLAAALAATAGVRRA